MLQQLYKKQVQIWRSRGEQPGLQTTFRFGWHLLGNGIQLLQSRFYLRKVQTNGWVMCRRKPSLHIRGTMRIGNGSSIWSNIRRSRIAVFPGAELQIGENTFINGARIASKKRIVIGSNVHIAPEVIIMDSDFHHTGNLDQEGASAEVIIGDNVWLATRAMLLKGVTIGEGAVVAAGAVVTKDVAPYTIVAGTPARFLKKVQL